MLTICEVDKKLKSVTAAGAILNRHPLFDWAQICCVQEMRREGQWWTTCRFEAKMEVGFSGPSDTVEVS
jgi:hypothetical protein